MKVVLDTNVLLAGTFARGLCEDLLDRCIDSDEVSLFTSKHILDEFERCAREKFHVPPRKASQARQWMRNLMQIMEPDPLDADCFSDPDDVPVLGTQLAAEADCLVTGDKALLKLKTFNGHRIVSPREFLDSLPPAAWPSAP